jgi:hypothetical protein
MSYPLLPPSLIPHHHPNRPAACSRLSVPRAGAGLPRFEADDPPGP